MLTAIDERLYHYAVPHVHKHCLRTNKPLERLLREVRQRTRAAGAFPGDNSALMLAAARRPFVKENVTDNADIAWHGQWAADLFV